MAWEAGRDPGGPPPQMDPSGLDVGGDVYQPRRRFDVPQGLNELSGHMEAVGNTLQQMAVESAKVTGGDQAVSDLSAGNVTAQSQFTAFGQGYNGVAQQQLGESRRAAMTEQMGEAANAHQADPAGLSKAFDDIQAGYGTTGYPQLDQQLSSDFELHRATLLSQAQAGRHAQMIDTQKGNYQQAYETGAAGLAQAAAGATLDAPGAARISGGYANFVQSLGQYGPKIAFDAGGVHFNADDSRAGAIEPAVIAAHAQAALGEAKRSWFENAQLNLPTADAKAHFADQMREQYQAGSPMFAGLGGAQAESLLDRLDGQAQKASTDEKADQAAARQDAEQSIQAIQWGSPNVDTAAMIKRAEDSGDPGLVAQANFLAAIPVEQRGVLKTVVARSMGLIPTPGEGGPGTQLLDAQGNVIGSAPPVGARFQAPVNARPTSNFGPRPAPMAGVGNFHPGVDYAVPTGTPVGAAADGVVIPNIHGAGFGNAVAIQHSDGSSTLYGHLSTVDVKPGDHVTAGQIIGASGSSGMSTGPHLHFGHYDAQGHAINPLQGLSPPMPGQTAAPPTPAGAAPGGPGVWQPPPGVQPGSPAFVAWANTKEGFTSDPINFARGGANRTALASVAPMNAGAIFSNDGGQIANWGAALRQRYAAGQTLATTYGVPPRIFDNGERDSLKAALAADPTKAVALARGMIAAIGPAGAMAGLREVKDGAGDDISTPMQLAGLEMAGNTNIVQRAETGMRLKQNGAKDLSNDQVAGPAALSTAAGLVAPAFRFAPQVLNAARNIASLARVADANTGVSYHANDYIQAALGGGQQNGRWFGGVANVNGQQALVPHWLAQDSVGDALHALGDSWTAHPGFGPAYANGAPMTANDVSKLVPVVNPAGTYWLTNPQTGRRAMNAHGTPIEVDMEANKAFLANRLPGAVLP